jgi:hypothetical protein
MERARVTQVVTEMGSFDAALSSFKVKYGVDVPSFIVLYEQGDTVATTPCWAVDTSSALPGPQDVYRRNSRALIRQIWPEFDFADMGDSAANPAPVGTSNPVAGNSSVDLNGDGDETDVIVLNGSECLVFFLGGVFSRGGNTASLADDALIGFAANPQMPFNATSTSNRVGPFFDNFAVNRFVDVDGDSMPEYLDPLPGQTRPYIYVSGKGGTGFAPFGVDGNATTVEDNEVPTDPSASPPAPMIDDIYRQDDGSTPPSATLGPYINLQSYQLISPGSDTNFGAGGEYDKETSNSVSLDDRDNITNFAKGRLN